MYIHIVQIQVKILLKNITHDLFNSLQVDISMVSCVFYSLCLLYVCVFVCFPLFKHIVSCYPLHVLYLGFVFFHRIMSSWISSQISLWSFFIIYFLWLHSILLSRCTMRIHHDFFKNHFPNDGHLRYFQSLLL